MSEYFLMGSLVAAFSIGAIFSMGSQLSNSFSTMVPNKLNLQVANTGDSGNNAGANKNPGAAHAPLPTTPPTANTGLGCFANGQCLRTNLTPYSSTQTAGANGINLVKSYAQIIKELATLAHKDSKVNPDFADMIDDLAADGFNVADDERSVLTWTAREGGMSFDIQNRYAETKARAMDYLQGHPNELTPQVAAILHMAANNITQQATDFVGGSNIHALNANNINQRFTDASGQGKGATYVDQNAATVCNSGGANCKP